jgi:hypothetical protein
MDIVTITILCPAANCSPTACRCGSPVFLCSTLHAPTYYYASVSHLTQFSVVCLEICSLIRSERLIKNKVFYHHSICAYPTLTGLFVRGFNSPHRKLSRLRRIRKQSGYVIVNYRVLFITIRNNRSIPIIRQHW